MRTIRELALTPVWLNPSHQVATARIVMSGHGLRHLAVMEDQFFVGVVSLELLARAPDAAFLREWLITNVLHLDAKESVHAVSRRFVDSDAVCGAAFDGEKYLGIVTSNMLLKEHQYSWDPHTQLSRSDRLRAWATDHLHAGTEISILFFDLNFFKHYNQNHGHVVGDQVLHSVAQLLGSSVDTDTDLLVRYGGDEFAIGTTRSREDAEALAIAIKKRADESLFDVSGNPITFCIGISGGRRQGNIARPNVPVGAIYDDLVNAASQACMRAKEALKKRMQSLRTSAESAAMG